MSELSILELERETVELLPAREALKLKPKKKFSKAQIAAAIAVAGDGGNGGNGGNGGDTTVYVEQNANAYVKGDYSEATAKNVSHVNVENASNGGNGGDGGTGGDAYAVAGND